MEQENKENDNHDELEYEKILYDNNDNNNIENEENININKNNSDFINYKNDFKPEFEENIQNIDNKDYNINNSRKNNNRIIEINNNDLNKDKYQSQEEDDFNPDINNENMEEFENNYINELQNKLNFIMEENNNLKIENQKMRKENENYEKIILNLNNDKNKLEEIIKNLQRKIPNENNQLNKYQKVELDFKSNYTDDQEYKDKIIILEKNNEQLSKSKNKLKSQNMHLQQQNKQILTDLRSKNNYITSIKDKMISVNEEYEKQIRFFEKMNDQSQSMVEQLFIERDKLIKENTELKNGINRLNNKIKQIIILTENKNNKDEITYYKSKLKEYKNRIVTLKNRIKELLGTNNMKICNTNKGKSTFIGNNNFNMNMIKNKSFRDNTHLNILTEGNLYDKNMKSRREHRKMNSNINFGINYNI